MNRIKAMMSQPGAFRWTALLLAFLYLIVFTLHTMSGHYTMAQRLVLNTWTGETTWIR